MKLSKKQEKEFQDLILNLKEYRQYLEDKIKSVKYDIKLEKENLDRDWSSYTVKEGQRNEESLKLLDLQKEVSSAIQEKINKLKIFKLKKKKHKERKASINKLLKPIFDYENNEEYTIGHKAKCFQDVFEKIDKKKFNQTLWQQIKKFFSNYFRKKEKTKTLSGQKMSQSKGARILEQAKNSGLKK